MPGMDLAYTDFLYDRNLLLRNPHFVKGSYTGKARITVLGNIGRTDTLSHYGKNLVRPWINRLSRGAPINFDLHIIFIKGIMIK
jgi:hypothetical protein